MPVFYENHQLKMGTNSKVLKSFLKDYSRPIYLYDLSDIQWQCQALKKEIPHAHIFYAMKANHHPEVLNTLRSIGCGLDIVSGGELRMGLSRGFLAENIIFSGVGKKEIEIELAISSGLRQINVESIEELERIARIHEKTKSLKPAPIVLRLNPHIAIESHPYISTGLNENKFGIPEEDLSQAISVLNQHKNNLELVGLSLHLGSQMTQLDPIEAGIKKITTIFNNLRKTFSSVKRLDLGGGLGIDYKNRDSDFEKKLLKGYADIINFELKELYKDPEFELQLEPGRWMVAHSGVLITQVQYVKKTKFKNFVIVDTGMHHLMRPALYQAFHQVLPLELKSGTELLCDVVGPICESSDFIAKERKLTPVKEGDFLAILDVGAYGAVLANDYNLQDRPLEITFT